MQRFHRGAQTHIGFEHDVEIMRQQFLARGYEAATIDSYIQQQRGKLKTQIGVLDLARCNRATETQSQSRPVFQSQESI